MELSVQKSAKGIIDLQGEYVNSDTISITYTCLPGSHPKTRKFSILLWQGEQPEDAGTAIKTHKIDSSDDLLSGSFLWSDLSLQRKDYIIGLSIDPDTEYIVGTSVVATLSIPEGIEEGTKLEASLSSLKPLHVGTDSLVVSYATPIYNLPATNNNWIALFNGLFNANCFNGTGVIVNAKATSDINTGNITLNGVKLVAGRTYTVVYGISINKDKKPNFKNISAFCEFKA